MTAGQSEWTRNPSADPMSYPGVAVPSSCILTHERLLPMTVRAAGWTVEAGPESGSVDEVLGRLEAAEMQHREPVLAIGSNASAGQLRHKWRDDPAMVVPMTAVSVTGIGIGHSPHVSKAGYIPYVPVDMFGTYRYFALWLTDLQIRDLDLTEPNYYPTVLRGRDYPVQLESGQELEKYLIYRGKWGVLADHEGIAIPAGTQDRALAVLNSLGGETFTHMGLAGSPEARDRARMLLQQRSISDHLIRAEETPAQTIDAARPTERDTGAKIMDSKITTREN